MAFERLVLASQSARRIDLLRQVGISFEAYASNSDEPTPEPNEDPEQYVLRTALFKARDVQRTFDQSNLWYLAADTSVIVENEILGKPTDEAHARQMLQQLAGRSHKVITGFVLLHPANGILHKEAVTTHVTFRNISPLTIQKYVTTGESMGKAGSYAIQGKAAAFVEKIEGCYFNVVGLPVGHVVAALEQHNAGTHF